MWNGMGEIIYMPLTTISCQSLGWYSFRKEFAPSEYHSKFMESSKRGCLCKSHSTHIHRNTLPGTEVVNPLYTGRLLHCYMLDESICRFRGVMSILSLLFYF